MNAMASSIAGRFDEVALKRGVASVRHPLTRALIALTFTTGLIDGVSYLALGHVFTANMTGNIVLLGFGIAGSGSLPVVAPIISLATFLLGAGAGGLIVERFSERHPALVSTALGIEATVAFAMGVRNAAVRHIAVPDLTTTVLTMTLTGLAADSRPAGGSGKGSVRRIAAVLTMLAGAICGGFLLKTRLFAPLALAAALALATCVFYIPAALRLGARTS